MGVQNPNSTSYVHPDEPNLLNIHKAMTYDPANGEPHLRVTLGSDNITVSGNVNLVEAVRVNNTEAQKIPVYIVGNVLSVTQGTDPWVITGNVIASQGTIPWSVVGNANITNTPNVHITNVPDVTGNVIITSGNINANVTQGTSPWVISGNTSVNSNTNPLYVNFTNSNISLSSGSANIGNVGLVGNLAGITGNLAGITGNIAGITGNVNIGTMPEVEIKNDSGNPIPVSANTSSNSGSNPIYVSANIANTTPITVAQSDVGVTAFDEPIAVPITPVIQADAQYGLDPDFWIQTKLRGGDITITPYNTWQVSSGTSAGGYARLATSKYMSYQDGQGSLYRWTAAFTATGTDKNAVGVDNIVQNTGPIDREDGYSFGFSGDPANRKIGILHRRNGRTEIRTLTITRAPTGNQTATIVLDGASYDVAITAGDVYHCANQIATALKAITTATNTWDIEGCNGVVSFTYYSPGAHSGTYSFSSAGTGTTALGTFAQVAAGTTPTDVWTYVDQWDNQTIAFDPTKLNVFQIDMRWLGAGRVRFFMEDPLTGKMVLVHTQRWAGTDVVPHINKPALRIAYRSGTTNPAVTPSQNVIVTGASVMSGVQGMRTQTGSSQGRYNIDSSTRAKDTVWHLMSLQNPFVRNGGVNKASLMLQTLTVAAQGNDPSVIYIVKDAFGLSDVLSYISIPNTTPAMFAQYSIVPVSIDLSTQRICNVQTLGINSSATFDLAAYNLTLAPGETISVFISSSNALNRTATGLTWLVD
jgi:lipopolysaccharide export system protein LptA